MPGIKAMIRNGRVEPAEPLAFPEGTEVVIVPATSTSDPEANWDDSPEGIAAWLKWYSSLEPFEFTEAELQELKKDREERKAWELAHAEERARKLQEMWE
jgi:hypothetical protein